MSHDLGKELRHAAEWASQRDAELFTRAAARIEQLEAWYEGRVPRTPLADEFERRAWNEFLADPTNPCWVAETYGMRGDRYRDQARQAERLKG
jgi:hypothetical protein